MVNEPQTRSTRRGLPAIEALCVLLLSTWTIVNWLARLNLSEDSTIYIAASENLLARGALVTYANWPSQSMSPSMEPYTEWPPGFPLYLTPFMLATRDPIIAAAVAQSLAIILYSAACYALVMSLGLSPLLRIASLVLLSRLGPFARVHSFFWTETLFIAIMFAIGALAIRATQASRAKWEWVCLLLLLFAGSSLKFTGVANIAWIAPLMLPRETVRAALRRPVADIITFAGGALVLSALLWDRIWPDSSPGLGVPQWMGVLLGVSAVTIGLAALISDAQDRSRYAWRPCRALWNHDLGWKLVAVGASFAPAILWLIRNKATYGVISFSHGLFQGQYPSNLAVPFRYIWDNVIGMRAGLTPVVLSGVVVLAILPFIASSSSQQAAHTSLAAVVAAHFAAVWLPSLVAGINTLDSRLLSPSLAAGTLLVLNGLQIATRRLNNRRWRVMLLLLPFAFVALNRSVDLAAPRLVRQGIPYPVESRLWSQIHAMDWTRESTHFYSDYDFVHQVFASIPQRIVWDDSLLRDPLALEELLTRGNHSFILMRSEGLESRTIEATIASSQLRVQRQQFPECGFVMYFLD